MSIHVALHHRTTYRYDRRVQLGPQVVRLRPAAHGRTPVLSYSLDVTPTEHFINWQQDPQGNYLARLVFEQPTDVFEVTVDLMAELAAINPFDFFLVPDAEEVPFAYDEELAASLEPYLRRRPGGARFRRLVESARPPMGKRTIDYLVEINQRLQQEVDYVVRMEPGVQTPEATLELGRGSCRDSAWLMVQLLRHLGMAARFVSGYLIQLVADQKPLDGPAGPSADFTDLHAWAEVYLPGAGWVGLDPTSGLLAGEGHIPLACTAEPGAAAPITGALDECEVEFAHAMEVTRVYETPRVTLPYDEAQWQAIDALGERVERALRDGDVRLTMGGEPTFVSMDDMEGDEWNTAALGADKERLAAELLGRLAHRFAPGGLLHFGQGKWYPGESLPRWAYGCHFRYDGQPLWRDPTLVADPGDGRGGSPEDAERFVTALARRLEVDARHAQPAHEDAFYYLWREGRLPVNVDPIDSRLDDSEERARLARVFSQGLDHVVGYALPLEPEVGAAGTRFRSGPMHLRGGRLFLVPGDSPMGLRLPMGSLPWAAEQDLHAPVPHDPHWPTPGDDLPWLDRVHMQDPAFRVRHGQPTFGERGVEPGEGGHDPHGAPAPGTSAWAQVRTTLCVEPRDGMLHVFMPPVAPFDAYEALVATVEATAAELSMPVRVEGYPPPSDPRVTHFSVTPDPGVIEVNLHPSTTWRQLEERTTALYEEARDTRLVAEKFMLDGRHTGTGGGNHITLGGPTPADSPLLRRPDLLRSIVGYWHDHPSLSYLFSGLFIGPTSQAPRIDEARHENLAEIEVAFAQIPDRGETPPWLVDRVFRNLLTDLTGNTHRAEMCIDKLYSPDGPAGRLGLLELRGFEMPPHPRMSLTQQLLVRALVAHFWDQPYHARLHRWGTSLHDRFMLPHFVAQDFGEVLDDLQRTGFSFDERWFSPHHEFRFPKIGEVTHDGVQVELRTALEPWHVLGEESATGGTARFVDSSMERLQVRVRGAIEDKHALLCNGQRVPLHPTGRRGEAVAGVRYRAWQPPHCLHPTIGVDSPLTFDVVDLGRRVSLGGCRYHVAHPGGRNHEDFPVNALAAQGRRAARFEPIGHSGGDLDIPDLRPSRDLPMTLDMRRASVARER